MESQRPDAIMKDEKAVALVTRMSYDFDQVRKIQITEGNKVARIMLTREMDRYVRDFLGRYPEAVVVHFGCGLDSRFERVDNGRVEWYDLDLPDVIGLRRKFIGDEGDATICWLLGARGRLAGGGEGGILNAPFCSWPKTFLSTSRKRRSNRWCSSCATISPVRSWSSTAGRHSSYGWATANSPVQSCGPLALGILA